MKSMKYWSRSGEKMERGEYRQCGNCGFWAHRLTKNGKCPKCGEHLIRRYE